MRSIGVIAVAFLVTVSCSGREQDEDAEASELHAPKPPVVTSVVTDDGFTQIRQNATVSLVIRGKRLKGTTSVDVSGQFVTLDSVSAREVRVTVFTGTSPLGPLDITLTTDNGTAVTQGAIELTPFVVSPTAVTGHGTFQSPINLCDPQLEFTGGGNVVQILAGTHHCDHTIFIGAGATIAGDPQQATILTGTDAGGFAISTGGPGAITTIRDVTFAPPLAEWSIFGDGELTVERVVDAGGILHFRGVMKLDHYTYEGEGTALDVAGAEIRNSSVRHCGSGDGIVARGSHEGAQILLDSVLVEDCQVGLLVLGPQPFGQMAVQISNAQFIDNRTGIALEHAFTSAQNIVIRDDESTPQTSRVGIFAGRKTFTSLSDVEITGQDEIGIVVFQTQSDNQIAQFMGDRLLIVGGRVGIEFVGIDNQLTLRNSIVRDQTVASLVAQCIDGRTDLGSPSDPGNNQLSVVSGFAIDDQRQFESFFTRYVTAAGTTLNGVSFDGETIEGPAELAPHYRIASPHSGIQF